MRFGARLVITRQRPTGNHSPGRLTCRAAKVSHLASQWYTWPMPTTRPRYQVTETQVVAHALDIAAQRWPGEPRSRLLLRLVETGSAALQEADGEHHAARRSAIDTTSGKYSGLFDHDYLSALRQDWPE